MGLDTVLQPSDMGDRLGRDGFKISEDWQSSHINGFTTGPNNGFASQNGQPGGSYMQRNGTSYAQSGESVGVAYQQSPSLSGHHGQAGQQEEYDGSWYSNQMG
jgi:hypothetical protein